MRNLIYTVVFLLVLFTLLRGIIFNLAEGVGIELPESNIVFISKDGGLNWEKKEIKNNFSGKIKFDKENPAGLIQASNVGIFEIKEGKEGGNINFKKNHNLGYVSDFFQDENNPKKFYLVSKNVEGDRILISEDGGETFKTIFKLSDNDKIVVFYKINNSFLIGTDKGILIESSDGVNWKQVKSFSPQKIISISKNINKNETYLVLGSTTLNLIEIYPPKEVKSQVLIYKNDSFFNIKELEGKNIKEVKVNQLSGDVFFISDEDIYFYQGEKISKINLISNFKIRAFTIDPKNPNILYIGGKNIIYRSTDKGKTWETIALPSNLLRIKEIEINPQDSNIILIKTSR